MPWITLITQQPPPPPPPKSSVKPETSSVTLGADLVDWLFTHVEGFADRRDARKYACNLLKSGYIRHTVNKLTFSEQCYYVFGDYYGGEYF